LAREWPLLLRPEHCWLYCRAAQQHGYRGASDLDLFARTFADAEPARSFYRAHDWDFDEVEYTYLERAATHQPGRFPEGLGPEHVARGESFLLQRSRHLERANRGREAIACVEVLRRLAPKSAAAHDRLAQLSYQQGDLDRAAELLSAWHDLDPGAALPLLRK